MEEVENQGAEVQEVAAPETIESTQEAPQVEAKAELPKSNHAWAQMRRERDDLERKAKMQEEILQKLLQQQAQTSPQAAPEEDILQQLEKEEYVPGASVAKALRKQQQDFDKKLKDLQSVHENKQRADQYRNLKGEFADYDEVVTPEAIALLEETEPVVAELIAKSGDPYKMAVATYKSIKGLGIQDKLPGARRTKEVEKKIEQNKKTVQSPQVFDKRPIAQAYQVTEAEKSKLYQEMMGYAQMAGGGY